MKTKIPDGLTTREGLNLAGRHDHRWSCLGSDEADWPSYRQRSALQRKSAASFRKDCQEPPYADPHVRWCGRREGKLSRRPDYLLSEPSPASASIIGTSGGQPKNSRMAAACSLLDMELIGKQSSQKLLWITPDSPATHDVRCSVASRLWHVSQSI